MSFADLKVGDQVERLIGGIVPMKMTVHKVFDDKIIMRGGWEFCRQTGAEIDEDLNWGPLPLRTGSYLVNNKKEV